MRSSVTLSFLALNLVTASAIPNSPGLAPAHYLQGDTSVPSSPIVPLTPLSPLSPNPAAYPNVHLSLYYPGKFKRQPPPPTTPFPPPTVLGAPSAPHLTPAAPPPDTPVPLSTVPAAPAVPAAPSVPTQPGIPTQLCYVSTSSQHTSQYCD